MATTFDGKRQQGIDADDLNLRVEQTRQDEPTNEKNYSVGLYDIDEALGFFFKNVLKPTILENSEIIQVPVLYGSPERWSAMTSFGAFRDNKGKLILPLIMYRKTNMAKNDQLVFPRVDQLYYLSARKFDSKDRYDDFAAKRMDNHTHDIFQQGIDRNKLHNFSLGSRKNNKTDKFALTALPNYVNITYECVVWTPFIEQMNKLIEKIQFSDYSFYGDPNKFKFRIILEPFDTAVELVVDTERMVKSTFGVTLYGYILSEDFNAKSTTRISLAPKKVIFIEADGQVSTITPSFIYDAQFATYDLDFEEDIPDVDLNVIPPV